MFLTAGCGPEPQPEPEKVALTADKTSLEFTADGGEQTIVVTASEKLYIVTGENWLKAKQGTKSADYKTEVTFTVQANQTTQERSVRVSLVAGDEKVYVDVTQAAAEKKDEPGGEDPIVPEKKDDAASSEQETEAVDTQADEGENETKPAEMPKGLIIALIAVGGAILVGIIAASATALATARKRRRRRATYINRR